MAGPAPLKTYGKNRPENAQISVLQSITTEDDNIPAVKKAKITDFFFKKVDTSLSPGGETRKPDAVCEPWSERTKERKIQLFLDFGQHDLSFKACPDCGMVYDRSFENDVRKHAKEHERAMMCFQSTSYEQVAAWRKVMKNGDQILLIKEALPQIDDFCNRINRLMGAVEQSIEEIRNLSFYLYTHRTRIVGFMSVEAVQRGYMMAANDQGHRVEHPVRIGVSRIWTDSNYRRKKIAINLLKSIRKCFHRNSVECTTNCCVPATLIAFSQPTAEGKALALKFLRLSSGEDHTDHIIVYFSDNYNDQIYDGKNKKESI